MDEWKSMFLSLCITSVLVTMTSTFKSPLEDDWGARNTGWLEPTEWVSSWFLNPSPAEVTHQWDTNSFIYSANSERPTDISPLNYFVTNFPIIFLLSPWSYSQTINCRPWINIYFHIWLSLLVSEVYNQLFFLNFCPVGGFPFTTVLQGSPRKRL